ncbi:hypothetical protein Leryth_022428 [Lithospermum erythrorhizon]|nr:hypothetical protein Leryth_022428 [Lithospermum erythrorhizon]
MRSQILFIPSNSHARTNISILEDASKYIEDLKQKVETLHQDVAQTSSNQNSSCEPVVTVETLEKGFLVNIYSDKSCPGLLVSVLEAFEELGLNVVEARISCTHSFHLETVGGVENEESEEPLNDEVVKQTILEAIKNWRESNNEQD